MGSLFVSGLATGLDTTSLISELVGIYSVPQSTLESQQDAAEDEQDLVTELRDLLSALEDAVEALDTSDELRAVTATASDAGAIEVSADAATAVAGTYTVEVTQLAASETEVSVQGFASADASLGTGTLTITVAGVATEVTVDAANGNDTLEDLAAWLNENVAGVTAYVLDDGSGTDPYRLVVQGDETGASQTVSITASLGVALTFTEATTAADAQFTVNGIAIESASNTVDGLVPGLTFELKEAGGGPVVLTVAEDVDGVVAKVEGFVDAYNAVMQFVLDQQLDADSGASTALTGDSLLRQLQTDLASVISGSYLGGTYEALAQLGFATQQDGTLELDTEALAEALEADLDAVVDLLTGSDGVFARMLTELDQALDEENGSVTARLDSLGDQIETLQERIEDWDRRIADYQERLTQQFIQLELVVAEYQATADYLSQLFSNLSAQE